MVLSLTQYCLLTIRDGVEIGKIRSVEQLPPRLRQLVMEFVVSHGTVDNGNCLQVLGTEQFLDGLETLDIQNDGRSDAGHLAVRISGILHQRADIAGQLLTLRLTICDAQLASKMVRLCPNVRSLSLTLRVRNFDLSSLVSSADKLQELTVESKLRGAMLLGAASLTDTGRRQRRTPPPPPPSTPNPRTLRRLRLVSVQICGRFWLQLMTSVQSTLELLYLEEVTVAETGGRVVPLPVPMPSLQQLIMQRCRPLYNQLFFQNLRQSCNVRSLRLELSGDEDPLTVERLSRIDVLDDVGLFCISEEQLDAILRAFGGKLSSFLSFNGYIGGSPRHFRLLAESCPQLSVLKIDTLLGGDDAQALLPFFVDPTRAARLRQVALEGPLPPELLNALFANCLNLSELELHACADVTDVHLRGWTEAGARPSFLRLLGCRRVTDDGLVPLLLACGLGLRRFFVDSPRITSLTVDVLAEHCRNVERLYDFIWLGDNRMTPLNLLRRKLFRELC